MPAPPGGADLTGATRYRETLFRRKLILEVEERFISYYEGYLTPGTVRVPIVSTIWRDATPKDLRTLDYLAGGDHSVDSGLTSSSPPGRFAIG